MRLFLAIPLPVEVRDHLANLGRKIGRGTMEQAIGWVSHENLHVTLKFLGEVDDGRVAELAAGLKTVAVVPARVWADRALCFPPHGPVRVIAIGLGGEVAVLRQLSAAVEESCAIMGFPRERRPYQPHITLGRSRVGRQISGPRALALGIPVDCFPGPAFIADSFVLMESDLGAKSPVYRPVARFVAAGTGSLTKS